MTEFKQKVTTYQRFFNVARKNGSRGDRTPLEILQGAAPPLDPRIAWMSPLFLDDLMREKSLTLSPQGGQNVPWHPYRGLQLTLASCLAGMPRPPAKSK